MWGCMGARVGTQGAGFGVQAGYLTLVLWCIISRHREQDDLRCQDMGCRGRDLTGCAVRQMTGVEPWSWCPVSDAAPRTWSRAP